jgi:hypothetical protein
MKEDKAELGDQKLGTLLRHARPVSDLTPGFQNAVWRRIERERRPAALLETLAQWFLTPRLATVAAAIVVLIAGGAGAARGIRTGERQARERYVASVDPSYLER